MPRSAAEWEAWFRKREKKKSKEPKRSITNTVSMPPVFARVIGEPSFTPLTYERSHIQRNALLRLANPTAAETQLKNILNSLNNGALRGRFQREYVISGKWIVDFFFPDIRLAIEVDGSIHSRADQRIKDRLKNADCERFDITMMRVTNKEVFGDRDELTGKLREGWKKALIRENYIIGQVIED